MKGCGGLSEVFVDADRHMHKYETAKKTEQMLNIYFLLTAQKNKAMKISSLYKSYYFKTIRLKPLY